MGHGSLMFKTDNYSDNCRTDTSENCSHTVSASSTVHSDCTSHSNDDNDTGFLSIKALSKCYHDSSTPVLENVSLNLEQGEFCCILGKSGCGKSTLLRCIAGFEDYTGKVLLAGKQMLKPGPDIIMVFQDFNQLFAWKTVQENMLCAIKYNSHITDKKQSIELGYQLLEIVGLKNYLDYYPHQLSGGMKQRAAIARALALQPKVMLMDEPFASLDAITRKHLQKELMTLVQKTHTTVLFVTHNIQEAMALGDRLLVFAQKGRIVYNRKNQLQKPVVPSTKGFSEVWNQLSALLDG